ncbi:cytochrome c oxidase subunit 3 [Paracoccus saliphilus]|uniref:Cytochrome c oxidase subunit 3 n=1 Tax=Paracoccus saliphilus TaxID=405559 RepID=A0AA45W5G8_9RHOB|nr:cytochrome c oxidase subunit 3 [Paracoccus saliphilus]WCR02327.1 cytochrome c oxidase subunit 3 [Paracoccus saliphilus]SIS93642.1 cytochrome c oxidase subunit 3 [Paracoccus saliphilus]
MNIILAFLAVLIAIIGWWLSRQRLFSKPWLETGAPPAITEASPVAPQKLGLGVFLAVVGGLFAMLGSAFVLQIDATPWQLVPLPRLVWINTAVLLSSSLFLQIAVAAARQGEARLLNWSLAAGVLSTLAFLVGQIAAWDMLTTSGYVLAGAPAASFFYLITGLHGLHILGGLMAMGAVWLRLARQPEPRRVQAIVALCALYWHALLLIWILLLALFTGWGNEFLALCRSVLR